MDETLGLPTETAVRVHRTVDPLAGSYFVESLTDQMENDANQIIDEVDGMGGVVQGIHKGYFRRSIAEASYRFGQEMEAGDRIIVGVNAYPDGNEDTQVELLQIPHEVETNQCEGLDEVINNRDNDGAMQSLDAIRKTARNGENVMNSLVNASLARCTLGEMVQAMADVFGRYSGGPEW
jgi:methylmalonyl-CoA mutase N-terminal domain/subunit